VKKLPKRQEFLPRVGFGFDAHDFSKKGNLILGGIRILGIPRLKGHSDGDALTHALIDAILGAAGLGDIGEHFPDTAPKYKGISSQKMLAQIMKIVAKEKLSVYQGDLTVVAERPHLKKFKEKIRRKLAKTLRISVKYLNIKAKTPEGTRILSSSGGIAAWAVVTLNPTRP